MNLEWLMFTWKGKHLELALFVSNCCIVFVFSPVYIIFIQIQFLYVLYLINFTFNDFIFSIKHSGFNQKTITHILDIVFTTQSHIFFIRNSFKLFYEISGPQICYWSMVGWSVVGALGWWSVCRWTDSRLVGD